MARHRSNRALHNDAAIRGAAVDLVLKVGIDAISFRDVGRAAKLSHGALYARFEDVEELLVDLWDHVLVDRAISLFEQVRLAASTPTKKNVDALVKRLRHSTPEDVTMVQVLLTSRRFVILHEEVEAFIHDYLEMASTESTGPVHARSLTLFALTIVGILSASQGGLDADDFECLEITVLEALKFAPHSVPPIDAVDGGNDRFPLPHNDLRAQLAYHTFLAVGKSGYARATISRISRRADCSPGAIYKLYPSKEDLVIGAMSSLMEAPWIATSSLADVLEPGNLAQLLYSAASDENMIRKSFALEVAMASAQSDKLRTAVRSQVRRLEAVVPLIDGLSKDERRQMTCMIRVIVFLTLGVAFLSTVTKATDQIDFNQFAEPLRRSFLENAVPSWVETRRQLISLAEIKKSAGTTKV